METFGIIDTPLFDNSAIIKVPSLLLSPSSKPTAIPIRDSVIVIESVNIDDSVKDSIKLQQNENIKGESIEQGDMLQVDPSSTDNSVISNQIIPNSILFTPNRVLLAPQVVNKVTPTRNYPSTLSRNNILKPIITPSSTSLTKTGGTNR